MGAPYQTGEEKAGSAAARGGGGGEGGGEEGGGEGDTSSTLPAGRHTAVPIHQECPDGQPLHGERTCVVRFVNTRVRKRTHETFILCPYVDCTE